VFAHEVSSEFVAGREGSKLLQLVSCNRLGNCDQEDDGGDDVECAAKRVDARHPSGPRQKRVHLILPVAVAIQARRAVKVHAPVVRERGSGTSAIPARQTG
jgi:hypothetical protein